jgi:hypothetical protein
MIALDRAARVNNRVARKEFRFDGSPSSLDGGRSILALLSGFGKMLVTLLTVGYTLPPPRSIGIIRLAAICEVILGLQSLTGKILIINNLAAVWGEPDSPCLRFDDDQLTGLWIARLDVTQVCWALERLAAVASLTPRKGRQKWAPACSKTKLCVDKCGIDARSLTVTEVSFGSWACGVMAAQFPAKVTVRVRIPPGPFLLC